MNILNKNPLTLLGLFILIVSIPVTVYLVQNQQIFKGKAATKSKLGIQTAWQKPGAMAFIEAAQPVVVKLMDGFNRAAEIKQKSPNTFIVGRIWEQNQPLDRVPGTRAQEWFNRNGTMLRTPSIDCWEGYNEPLTNTTETMQWYSRFEIKRMQLLESIGRKACIGNFSVGNPDFSLWQYFRDAMNYARDHGHYLGLHEYGPTSMSDRWEDFSLRHRRVYRDNNFTLPLIISETGIDSGGCDNCDNPQNGCGWRAHTNATDYFNQLKWYDSRLQQDSYVKGAIIFSYGLYNWCSFEIYPELVGIDGRSGSLTAYIRGGPVPTPTPRITPSPTPRITPTPTPSVCLQVVTYARNPLNGDCQQFPSPCKIPQNWEVVSSCKGPAIF